ncbi:Pr6Pr family membrane protein [Aeromicrobium sp. CF3.5]|uniref:Pr6Pr family membrane protein n=1 Tax=Aeromicrobium sp. CF3.5 TaxID=3373078 RepID=UPI003EE67523
MNSTITRVFHASLAMLIAAAVVWQTVISADAGRSLVNLFSYFTIQSNLLIMVGAAGVALDPHRSDRIFGAVRVAGLVGITVTGIVYATVLAGTVPLEGADRVLDTIFHYIVPAASVIGFVLIQPRTPLQRSAWWALVWPVGWLVYTLLRAVTFSPTFTITETTTARVPYDFLDFDANGAGSVAIACVVVTAIAVALTAFYLRVGGVRREVEPA